MTDSLSSGEAAIIKAILERSLESLDNLIIQEKSLAKSKENTQEPQVKGSCSIETLNKALKKTKCQVEWLRTVLRDTVDELSNETYHNLSRVVRTEEVKERCKREKAEDERQKRLVEEEEIKRQDAEVKQQIDEAEITTELCPISKMATYKRMAYLNIQGMSHAITELDEVLFYEKEQEALKKVLEEAEYAAKMEERSLEIQRNFLEKEKIKRAKDIEEWYQRFHQDREELNENITKLQEDIELLQQSYRWTKDTYMEKKEVLSEHKERKKKRKVLLESEVPFRNVQSWWRGTVVRLRLGDYGTRFVSLQQIIHKRKEEEAKFLKKLKQKYAKKK